MRTDTCSLQQDDASRRFARLPSGHPMGYYDAVYNLFSDFYAFLEAKQKQRPTTIQIPDFNVGYNQMQIVEAVLLSHQQRRWVPVA